MSIKFNEGSHRYWLDGKPIPGVTTLIKGGLPSPALVYWSAKAVAEFVADNDAKVEELRGMGRGPLVAALKEVPWTERDKAGVRGTEVHALAEELVQGREVEVPEHLADVVDGYVRWLDEWQPEALVTERPCASRKQWYAGTFDVIARMNGEVWLLDWKSAKGVYGDNALQVALYANAEFYVDANGVEQPMPKIDRLGIVHVQPDRTDLYPMKPEDNERAYRDALHVLWTAKAKKRIDGYLSEPAEPPAKDSAA